MSDRGEAPGKKTHEPWMDENMFDRRAVIKGAGTLHRGAAASGLLPSAAQSQGSRQAASTLIKGGHVISMDKKIGDFETGDVLMERGTITAVGKNLQAPNAEIVDASSKLVLPGFVNAHSHTWAWMTRTHVEIDYWNLAVTKLMPFYRSEDTYISSLLCGAEMLNAGITTMWDYAHGMRDDSVADGNIRGLRESGIRGIFGHALPHVPVPASSLEGARRIKQKYFNSPASDDLVTLGVSTRLGEPYPIQWPMPPAMGKPYENAVHDLKLAREIGVKRIHMHATFKPEMAVESLVTRLHNDKLLGPDITFVHADFVTEDEIKMMADSGAAVVPPTIQRFQRHGVTVGVGDDAGTTRTPINLCSAMRTMLQRDLSVEQERASKEGGTAAMVTYRQMLETATMGSAGAVGLADKVGSLTPGKRADVIIVDLDNISMLPLEKDPASSIVMMAQPSDVSWVFVDGQVRKRAGKLVGVDRTRVRNLAQSSYEYLRKQTGLPLST